MSQPKKRTLSKNGSSDDEDKKLPQLQPKKRILTKNNSSDEEEETHQPMQEKDDDEKTQPNTSDDEPVIISSPSKTQKKKAKSLETDCKSPSKKSSKVWEYDRQRYVLDRSCSKSGFVFKDEHIRKICYYTYFRQAPPEAKLSEKVIVDKTRIKATKSRHENELPFSKFQVKDFANIWVEIKLSQTGFFFCPLCLSLPNFVNPVYLGRQMRPLVELRQANANRQALFDVTMIKLITWEDYGQVRDISEKFIAPSKDRLKTKLKTIINWYARCVRRQSELHSLRFPWGDDVYGSLQLDDESKNVVYLRNEDDKDFIYKPPKTSQEDVIQHLKKMLKKKGMTVYEKANKMWSILPKELTAPFKENKETIKNHLCKKKITAAMRAHGHGGALCEQASIQRENTCDKENPKGANVTFFVDPGRRLDWALVFRISASYMNRPSNSRNCEVWHVFLLICLGAFSYFVVCALFIPICVRNIFCCGSMAMKMAITALQTNAKRSLLIPSEGFFRLQTMHILTVWNALQNLCAMKNLVANLKLYLRTKTSFARGLNAKM